MESVQVYGGRIVQSAPVESEGKPSSCRRSTSRVLAKGDAAVGELEVGGKFGEKVNGHCSRWWPREKRKKNEPCVQHVNTCGRLHPSCACQRILPAHASTCLLARFAIHCPALTAPSTQTGTITFRL